MSLVSMTLAAEGTPAQEREAANRRARWLRPALGLLVPVTLAVAWEIVVRLGWASGRLAPPPSVVFQTFADLARTGELQRDTLVTLWRVAAGFADRKSTRLNSSHLVISYAVFCLKKKKKTEKKFLFKKKKKTKKKK